MLFFSSCFIKFFLKRDLVISIPFWSDLNVIYFIKPSREILEGIVASVFEGLGFKATTNAKRESRKASPIEVDVWAEKKIADTSFSVYVSCKNWDRAVDRSVIDEETGRVLSLKE